ncbi:MAG: transposase [Chloroflexaceae bacterium]|nr:transposase [Chloroflexaceae bacterium]
MSPRKLTVGNKQEILELYRQTPETTSTLAERFGVSSSTISRFLKTSLSEQEYEELIQQKRLSRTPSREWEDEAVSQEELPAQLPPVAAEPETTEPRETPGFRPIPRLVRRRRRSSAIAEEPPLLPSLFPAQSEEESDEPEPAKPSVKPQTPAKLFAEKRMPVVEVEEDMARDADLDRESLEEMFGEDLEDEDLEEFDEDDEGEEDLPFGSLKDFGPGRELRVFPLSEATLPKICFLVVDRGADLITRPLKEFGHLGQIPASEIARQTLPVFDNLRVAKRFSNRHQRVIKVPDGRLLKKVSSYLEAKGITRLLIDGKVYALESL